MNKNHLIYIILFLLLINNPIVAIVFKNDIQPTQNKLNNESIILNYEKQQKIALMKKLGDKYISVKFVNAPISRVLNFFSSELDINILPANALGNKLLSFSFENIHIVDAFDLVLQNNGFIWQMEKDLIKIIAESPIRIYYLDYAQADEIITSLKAVISEGAISRPKGINALIVKAPDSELSKIERLIKELDVIPKQVLVEVKMLEVQEGVSNLFESQVNYDSEQNSDTKINSTSSSGLFVKVLSQDFEALLQTVRRNQDIKTLATPKILALNHKPASIVTGQELGYRLTNLTAGGIANETIKFMTVGTQLNFTPHISEKGYIIMEIRPEVSEGSITDGIPNKTTTNTNTTVLVKDGQTILIGGLIRDKRTSADTWVPFLSDIPIINLLFQKGEVKEERTELVVLITPHLVTPELLDEMKDSFSEQTSVIE